MTIGWTDQANLNLSIGYSPWDQYLHGHDSGTRVVYDYGVDRVDHDSVEIGSGVLKLQRDGIGGCLCSQRRDAGKLVSCGEGCRIKNGTSCVAEPEKEYVENAYLASGELAPGVYRVSMYNRLCSKEEKVSAMLSVSLGGEFYGRYKTGKAERSDGSVLYVGTLYVPPK